MTFSEYFTYGNVLFSYIVNTRLSEPHTDQITSINFLPNPQKSASQPLLFVTTSLDSRFKIYNLIQPSQSVASSETYWSPRSQGFQRDLPLYDSAFSSDASVLAIAAGSSLTLWDPWTGLLQATFSYPPSNQPILSVKFITAAASFNSIVSKLPFLVALTRDKAHVWNLLTGTVWWSASVTDFIHGDSSLSGISRQSKSQKLKKKDRSHSHDAPIRGIVDGLSREVIVDEESGLFLVIVDEVVKEPTSVATSAGDDADSAKNNMDMDIDASQAKSSKKKSCRFTAWTRLLLFDPSSPDPLFVHHIQGRIRGATFLPSATFSKSSPRESIIRRLLIFSSRSELLTMGSWIESDSHVNDKEQSSDSILKSKVNENNTPEDGIMGGFLTRIYGTGTLNLSKSADNGTASTHTTSNTNANTTSSTTTHSAPYSSSQQMSNANHLISEKDKKSKFTFLNSPSHLLPRPSLLVQPFLEAMLVKRSGEKNIDNNNTTSMVDVVGQNDVANGDIDSDDDSMNKDVDISDNSSTNFNFLTNIFRNIEI